MPLEPIVSIVLLIALGAAWGWGKLSEKWFCTTGSTLNPIWQGLAVLTWLTLILHFVVPISSTTAVVLCGIGLLSAFVHAIRERKRSGRVLEFAKIGLALLAVGFIAMFSGGPYSWYDTGLYHDQTVLWNVHQAITPGLANLHSRFGYNSSLLNLASLFEWLPGGASHYAASLWGAVALIHGLWSLRRLWQKRHSGSPPATEDVGWVIFMIPLALMIQVRQIPSLSTDFPPLVAGMSLVLLLLRGARGEGITRPDMAASIVIAALLCTQKFSVAVFAVACLLMIMIIAGKQQSWCSLEWRRLVPAVIFAVILGLTWIVRGIVLSGYPLYPLSLMGLEVDWRVPKTLVDSEAAWILSWARFPRASPDRTIYIVDWIGGWLQNRLFSYYLIMPAAFALIALLIGRLRHSLHLNTRPAILFFIPFGVGFLYWWVTAPDPRFATLLLWGAAIGFWILVLPQTGFRSVLPIVLISALTALNTIRYPPVPTVEAREFVTNSGLIVYTPAAGDRCFDLPLPCTPYPNANLMLRGDSIREGFRIK